MKKHVEAAASLLVKADIYLAVVDSSSPANAPGLFKASLDQAWDRVGGPTATGKLDLVNDCVEQYWAHRQAAQELLVWSPGSGVYRVEFRLSKFAPKAPASRRDGGGLIGKAGASGTLSCPSGELIVGTLSALGGGKAAVRVPPGSHRLVLEENSEQIRRHWSLADEAAYEEGGEPDFILWIQSS